MTEQEYLDTSNLARLKIAHEALRTCVWSYRDAEGMIDFSMKNIQAMINMVQRDIGDIGQDKPASAVAIFLNNVELGSWNDKK